MMYFSGGMDVERLKVDRPSGCAILFGAYDHSVAPCDRFSNWYGFEYSQSHISV